MRLALGAFKEEARKLGAKKFVRLPMAPGASALIAALGSRLAELEEDGDPTSQTASSEAEVMVRGQRYIDMKSDDEPEPNASEPDGAPATAHWGFVSGFCGADSMSFAARELGGVPVAGFDVDETVQGLWSERTGMPCWGELSSVLDAPAGGLLDDLVSSILIYISGSPCPDFSSAGCGRSLLGETGSLWLDDCELGIRLRPPVPDDDRQPDAAEEVEAEIGDKADEREAELADDDSDSDDEVGDGRGSWTWSYMG